MVFFKICLGIYAASKKAFAALGDQCSNWLDKIIAMGADGAAVNLGSKGGVKLIILKGC